MQPQVKEIEISKLTLLKRNPRKISAAQVDKLVESLKDDPDFLKERPVLVNEVDGVYHVYAGNQRVRAAKKLNWKKVPCSVSQNLDEKTIRARIIKDNKTFGEFDWDILANEWEAKELVDYGFTLEELQIGNPEIEQIESEEESDVLEPVKDEDAETKLGDVYELESGLLLHRIICGDSTHPDIVEKVLNDAEPNMVYTDPPYGISYHISDGKQHGNSACKRNNFNPIKNDESTQTAIDAFNFCTAIGIQKMIWWGANYYANSLPPSSCWIIWDKDTGSNDFPDCEIAWCSEDSPSRIFKHTWNGMIKESERGEKRIHPTQKPIALAKWCIEKYSDNEDTVFDLFLGSGSTLIAAEMLDRQCFGIELSPAYCDIIVDRWVNYMKKNQKPFTIKKNGETLHKD